MKTSTRILTLIVALLLTACNAPGSEVDQPLSVDDQAATIVAETMQAAPTSAARTPFASPVAALTTPAGKATLFINTDNATCRSGPGTDFKIIARFPSGTTVDLVGRDSADNYWIVTDPATQNSCWVQIQDATPAGSFNSLPDVTPQAPAVGVPSRPGSLSYNFFCDNTTLTTSISWTDTANNENGYRVFRKDAQIADLPANSTTYSETIPYTQGVSEVYSVIAYNDAGVSETRSTPAFTCQ